jgi:hypothetical protein
MFDLAAIERESVIKGLVAEELSRFNRIIDVARDRVSWENKWDHLACAAEIKTYAIEIAAITTRREVLEAEHEQAKHS